LSYRQPLLEAVFDVQKSPSEGESAPPALNGFGRRAAPAGFGQRAARGSFGPRAAEGGDASKAASATSEQRITSPPAKLSRNAARSGFGR